MSGVNREHGISTLPKPWYVAVRFSILPYPLYYQSFRVVEAAGVELITMLTARKLLILGSATRAKKAPLPGPLYVYCTKMFSLWVPADAT
jgi:hypothetical protein